MKFAIYKYELVKQTQKNFSRKIRVYMTTLRFILEIYLMLISLIYIKSLIRMDCLNAFLIQFLRHVME